MEHPINDLMATTLSKIREMVDVSTVIGDPIQVSESITIVPISRVSFGFASGGSDFVSKNHKPEDKNSFAGGSGAGVSVQPVSFLVIKGDNIRMVPAYAGQMPIDRIIDMVPEMVDKISDLIKKDKSEEEDTQNPF